ncbi:tRNA(Ile)-lysidine synthase [Bartonella silvatica]|uniref:tRNA(Ile)-lysidine synthase n=1 Tax=Bartonella silvatica TaxID=357760 RepID=A0ABV2HH04_9HYPH
MRIRLAGNLFKASDFVQCQRLILAVSGGGDSLALLFLLKDYLETLSAPPEMIAVTIDHQLRTESAREAESVAEICRAHHIKHVIVRWEGKKPRSHIASSARIARYNLLFQEAQKQGATLIMTGHTLNDQVETYQMRYQRFQKGVGKREKAVFRSEHDVRWVKNSADVFPSEAFGSPRTGEDACNPAGVLAGEAFGGMPDRICLTGDKDDIAQKNSFFMEARFMDARGLSCIPREALLCQKIRLIRPLLGVRREILRAYLRLKKKTWIDDPTNEDRHFERVRVRQALPPQKLTVIAQRIHEATLKRRQQAQMIADLILALDITVEYGRGFIAKPAPFLQQHPAFPFVVGLFAVLMGGGYYLLPVSKLITLAQRLCFGISKKQRFTYAGSVIEYDKRGIAFWRESRNMKEAIVEPGKTLLWDGRYQIRNHGNDTIKVGAAHLKQLKSLLKNSCVDLKKVHFPSLQSLLMISNNKDYDIPELTHHVVFHKNIVINRVMAPFNWLLSYEDVAFVNVVEPFFNIEVKR